MTDARIAYLFTLCNEATPGPWEYGTFTREDVCAVHGRVFMRGHENPQTNTRDCPLTRADAKLIAEARTAIPELLWYIAELKGRIEG